MKKYKILVTISIFILSLISLLSVAHSQSSDLSNDGDFIEKPKLICSAGAEALRGCGGLGCPASQEAFCTCDANRTKWNCGCRASSVCERQAINESDIAVPEVPSDPRPTDSKVCSLVSDWGIVDGARCGSTNGAQKCSLTQILQKRTVDKNGSCATEYRCAESPSCLVDTEEPDTLINPNDQKHISKQVIDAKNALRLDKQVYAINRPACIPAPANGLPNIAFICGVGLNKKTEAACPSGYACTSRFSQVAETAQLAYNSANDGVSNVQCENISNLIEATCEFQQDKGGYYIVQKRRVNSIPYITANYVATNTYYMDREEGVQIHRLDAVLEISANAINRYCPGSSITQDNNYTTIRIVTDVQCSPELTDELDRVTCSESFSNVTIGPHPFVAQSSCTPSNHGSYVPGPCLTNGKRIIYTCDYAEISATVRTALSNIDLTAYSNINFCNPYEGDAQLSSNQICGYCGGEYYASVTANLAGFYRVGGTFVVMNTDEQGQVDPIEIENACGGIVSRSDFETVYTQIYDISSNQNNIGNRGFVETLIDDPVCIASSLCSIPFQRIGN